MLICFLLENCVVNLASLFSTHMYVAFERFSPLTGGPATCHTSFPTSYPIPRMVMASGLPEPPLVVMVIGEAQFCPPMERVNGGTRKAKTADLFGLARPLL